MRPSCQLLFLGLLLPLVALAGSDAEPGQGQAGLSNPHAWLVAMAQALRQLNYEGELIYQQGQHLETLHQRHWIENGAEREQLTSLDGPLRELVRGPHGARCRLSNSESVSIEPLEGLTGLPTLNGLIAQGLEGFYAVDFGGQARLAGRQTQIIEIRPKDELRYGFRIYLDQASRLPLRQMLLDTAGEPLVTLMYSRLEVNPHPASLMQEHPASPQTSEQSSEQSGQQAAWHRQAQPVPVAGRHWQLHKLPPGFQAYLPRPHPDTESKQGYNHMEHLVLSDGLVSVSLYVEPASDAGLEGALRRGATGAYGRRLGGFQITAVGEVPEAALRRIVEAVSLR